MSKTILILVVGMLIIGNTATAEEVPSARELALQTGGGAAGYVLGSMLGLLGGPMIGFTGSYEHCDGLPDTEIDPVLQMTRYDFCFLEEASLRGNQLDSYAAAGAALGTVTGVLMSARAQGFDGSIAGASLGTLLGYALMKHLNMSSIRQITFSSYYQNPAELTDEAQKTLQVRAVILQYLTPIVVSILALIGYHLL